MKITVWAILSASLRSAGTYAVTATGKVVGLPAQAERETGWVVKEGGTRAVSVAEVLVTLPQTLVTTQS